MSYLPILILAQFAALYPITLWLAPVSALDGGFFRFNLGLTTILLSLASLLTATGDLPTQFLGLLAIIAAISLVLLGILWQQPERARLYLTPLLVIWGFTLWQPALAQAQLVPSWVSWVALALGGLALAAVMYTMVLGHWYLNVADLPIKYLQRATKFTMAALSLRILWALAVLLFADTIVDQRLKPAYTLLGRPSGVFLWMGLGPGLLAGLAVTWMSHRTAAMQSTQSTTGLLYVALILVAIGTLIFTGFLLLRGLPL